ncbi:CRISPR locus-related DNA-binding protein [Candidatus Woesearchaeota archaeon]|nr:CRISPR locus-related DNA-binding protein [Candidatus Woesearchaeota archaeon]
MGKVLIASLYGPDPVILAATRLAVDRLFLLVNKEADKVQEEAIKVIDDSFGRVLDIKYDKIDPYDIVSTAKKVVQIIDHMPKEDLIYVNVTSGRKTMALGILYGAYARVNRIKKIGYNPTEDKNTVVYLPKLSFNLTDSQKKVLLSIEDSKFENLSELAKKVDISPAMLYRNIKDLENLGLIETEEGIKLTDAGRIAVL